MILTISRNVTTESAETYCSLPMCVAEEFFQDDFACKARHQLQRVSGDRHGGDKVRPDILLELNFFEMQH
ncbi:hypothetical protein V5799_015261 [Amblyomma americanum]|uniref:Uncharacterized protein n=1 Tax=Amblyomma americanum TaxID=6943 RepID=A0AAQ4E0N4_AMBAM